MIRLKGQKIQLSENDVERQCLDLLRYQHWHPVRLHVGTFQTTEGAWVRVGQKGIPDYVVIHSTFPAFFLEAKRPGGRVSRQQEAFHSSLRAAGLAVVVVDGVEALKGFLRRHEGDR